MKGYNCAIMPERKRYRHETELKKRQRQPIYRDLVSRSNFIKLAAAGSIGIIAAVYGWVSLRRGDEGQIYEGEVTALRGHEIISKKELDGYLDSLEGCSVPFLRRLGTDIRYFATTKVRPSGLPGWINEESFPMAFTKSDGPESTAALDILWNANSPYAFRVNWQEHGIVDHPMAVTSWMGTNIGITKSLKGREALVKGIFLAKEHLSHLLIQRFAEDFHTQLDFFGINEVTELDGSPINDPTRLRGAAVSILLNQENDRNTTVWKTTDGLPAFYLAIAMNELIRNGELPADNLKAIGRFMDAHRIILNDIATNSAIGASSLGKHMDSWINSRDFMLPRSVSDAYHNPIQNMINEWHNV